MRRMLRTVRPEGEGLHRLSHRSAHDERS